MKYTLFIALISIATALANRFSFSEFTSTLASSPTLDSSERNIITDVEFDEEERIYGGSNAKFLDYPYIVGLRASGPDDETFWGGTLMAPQYVLMAAYCLEWYLLDVYASLGTQRKAGRGSRKSEQIRVIEAFRHSLYYAKFLLYDVAILKLERPSVHQPARLCAADGSANKPGTVATVLGWGLVNNGTFGGTLQTVDVQIIPDVECDNYTINSNIMMCAGTERGKDACNGDSGGPLIANGALVGIVSGAPGECGDMPGLYARVARVHDYIKDILSGGSSVNVTEMLTQGGRFNNGIERRPVARSKICTQ